MTVMTDILEWSAERPVWQSDALRRIVTQRSLSDKDIVELRQICLAQRGITDTENPAPNPNLLTREHLPSSRGLVEPVQLVELREIHSVNALAADQRLNFGPDGLTIVFGYNGSGKSGYARILRSLCHARYQGEHVLQNVFVCEDQPTPSAIVDYTVAGSGRSDTWQQGQETPAELRQISFFDADCAAVHVNDANELAFTPFGLDVLSKLVNACQRIKVDIDELVRDQERARSVSITNPQVAEGTRVYRMLELLDKDSDIETFRQSAELSDQNFERIEELRGALGADPVTLARELRNKVTRLRRLQQNTRVVSELFSVEAVSSIHDKLQNVIIKKTAAHTAAEQAFGNQPLSGVGEQVWQRLWEAARNYSQQKAYPEQEFPFTGEDALCVLCQQSLNLYAQGRLNTFEAFIKAETQQAATRAEVDLNHALIRIQQLNLGHSAFEEYLPDLPDNQPELRQAVRRFFGITWKMRRSISRSCADAQWNLSCDLPLNPDAGLQTLIEGMLRRSEELDRAAVQGERQTLLKERNELLACKWLAGILVDVEAEIGRKKKLAALNLAISDTVTTGITRKSSELADIYVTDVIQDRLTTEINALGAAHLRVELDSPGGRLGQKRFKISLHGAPENTEVCRVLSEGEFRCIALAGFLAELSTENSGSAIIFDDPVCSLDHQWRRKVACRLVQLASERQVIIFTHDIVFLADLMGYCEANDIALLQKYLVRGPNQPGECVDGLPWVAMKVSKRIGYLKGWHHVAEAKYQRQGQDIYEPEARRIYGRLRETWERAVEEVLLDGVVMRFDRAIHTQKLMKLHDITNEDIQTIDQGMTKSSRFLEGHDEAGAIADPVPDPDEVLQDINALEEWVKQVRRRRN